MGLSAAAAERRDPAVHQLHPVEKQGDGRFQDCRPSWAGQVDIPVVLDPTCSTVQYMY